MAVYSTFTQWDCDPTGGDRKNIVTNGTRLQPLLTAPAANLSEPGLIVMTYRLKKH